MNFLKGEDTKKDYFTEAKSWADDVYGNAIQSKNRYKTAFLSSIALNMVTGIALMMLATMQTLEPIIIHHYDNGVTTVEPLTNENAPLNRAQVESDIIRYITNRESFDLSSYKAQYDLVTLLSAPSVASLYAKSQDKNEKESPLNQLGSTHLREVHVFSINFLDNLIFNEKEANSKHHNLVEVVFSLIDVDKVTGQRQEKQFNAMISWVYKKPSMSPEIRWKNWDGFLVTSYNKQIRNI